MVKLFREFLSKKRSETDANILRLQNGVKKLIEAADDVVRLEANLKMMLEAVSHRFTNEYGDVSNGVTLQAEEKRLVASQIAENVTKEKLVVEEENAKALIEEKNVAEIQAEVSIKHNDAAKDLEQAEPALVKAMTALELLDRRDLNNCKTVCRFLLNTQ
jgi:dynein heavy chain